MATFHVVQEGPVNALALNRDNTQVAIGGRNVFKVYAIEDDKFREVYNLRASKHLNLNFSCNDVSWSWIDDHYLATAATNGHVCVWNLTKMGRAMQEQDYQEHKRTVNKVNFHYSEPYRLISGSQDGTMRYFDIRLKSAVAIFDSNTESVRDVQFSPHNAHTFAAVSENGSVQIWDVRRPDKCQQQYTAHSGPIFACDWHSENAWLATASRDKTIKVWDLASKPTLEYTIHTIASIGHVKWRPQLKYHIASCALVVDCSINIWDVRRPYIPFAAFNEHKDIASGVAWKDDPNVFLSSGRDSTLYQHSFNVASRPASKANPQGISLNNRGEILYTHKVNVVQPVKSTGARKTSTTLPPVDQFHLASSLLHQFKISEEKESQVFVQLARNYVLCGRSLSEMCEHNSAVANQFGKHQIAVVWKIVKTMYGEEYLQTATKSNSSKDDATSHNNLQMLECDQKSRGGDTPAPPQFSDDSEPEDEVDHISYQDQHCRNQDLNDDPDADIFPDCNSHHFPQISSQQEYVLPHEAFNIKTDFHNNVTPESEKASENEDDAQNDEEAHQSEATDHLLHFSYKPEVIRFDPSSILTEALKYHAIVGDVQTSASVLIVLGDQRKCLLELDENLQEHWLLGYIEQLNRFQLWNVTSQVIKLSWLASVEILNQQSTRFNSKCSKCSKALQRIGWLCDRCHSSQYGLCSVCHQVVKGLYAWCQGCSHGGHLAHLKQWFSKNRLCPTGCRHMCEYK